ncbi:MAG TPA: aldo/keto reductase, partial [Longimicrobiales bacterium]|nr:aldo/keto reductase [Longimicrobiales bacterium]
MNPSRRTVLKIGAATGAALLLDRLPLGARQEARLILKPIPSSGEEVPVVGLGSWRTFDVDPSSEEAEGPREVLRLFHELGGRVVDTAPSYGRSEAFVGAVARETGIEDDLFLATKVNVEDAGAEAAYGQMDESSEVLGRETLDLMQVWNLGDRNFRDLTDRYLAAHIDAVREWKSRGRARYIGITTSFPQQYGDVEEALRNHEMDFVQLDYSIGDRVPEERLLPLARDRGVAVLVNQPFTSGRLFSTVEGRALPEWAGEIGCESWAQ